MGVCKKTLWKIASALLAVVMALSVAGVGKVEAQAKEKKNIVILYFSATGTTKAVAKKIKKTTEGQIIEIKAEEPYSEADLDWTDDDSRVVEEHESADSPAESTVRPEISNIKEIKSAVKKADVVYIGYPIWWGEAPHIVYNLVENVSLKGKTVVPFCTSMSSGLGKSAKNLKKNAVISKKTDWRKGRNFYDVPSQKTVDKWIKGLKIV